MVLSQPTWLWGAEHGVNEHGVAIGNEKVWTVDDPRGKPAALIGMDIVRLALERAETATQAVAIIAALIEAHGQGGSGERDHDEPYHSAFLVADPREVWVVETSDRTWAARRTVDGGAAISNRLSLTDDWDVASSDVAPGRSFQDWRAPKIPTTIADHRLAATTRCVTTSPPARLTARAIVATLRDHGANAWRTPGEPAHAHVAALPLEVGDDHRGVTVCMHVRGFQATTASMIVEVDTTAPFAARTWSALGSPCASVYLPGAYGVVVPQLASEQEWARFAALRDRVEAETAALTEVRKVLSAVETELWDEADSIGTDTMGAGAIDAWRVFVDTAYGRVDAALTRLGV